MADDDYPIKFLPLPGDEGEAAMRYREAVAYVNEFLALTDIPWRDPRMADIRRHVERMNAMLTALHGHNERVVVMLGRQLGKQVLTQLGLDKVEAAAAPVERGPRKPWQVEAWRNKRGKNRCR